MAEKIKVNIAGIDYTLTSESEKTQIQQIAAYVDKKIKEIDNDKLTRENQLLLAALNVTDEMYNILIKYNKLRQEAKDPIEKYPKLKKDYEKVRADFEKSKNDFMESMKKIEDLNSNIKKLNQEIENKDKIIKSKDENLKQLRKNLQKLQDENLNLNKLVKELERDL